MSQPRILVIDDDPLFRSLLSSVLRKEYVVEVAKDGAEGFEKAIISPPDAAIIDVNMPGWDGMRTLEAFRNHHATARCPVVMLTGDSSQETVITATKLGAAGYVVKTCFGREELLRTLDRALRSRSLAAAHGPSGHLTGFCPAVDTVTEDDLQAAVDHWE